MSWEWKESVTEMEGVDGMEIGTSPVLRGEAWQSSSSLDGPPIQSCVCSELLFSLGIRLCVILYLFLLSALCLTLTSSLFSCSVSRYYSPYSVHLGTVTTAAADSPSSWVRSPTPPHPSYDFTASRGSWVSFLYRWSHFSLRQKKDRSPLYILYLARSTGGGKRYCSLSLTGALRMMKDLLSTLKFKTAVIDKSPVIAAYIGCNCGLVPCFTINCTELHHKVKNEIKLFVFKKPQSEYWCFLNIATSQWLIEG